MNGSFMKGLARNSYGYISEVCIFHPGKHPNHGRSKLELNEEDRVEHNSLLQLQNKRHN